MLLRGRYATYVAGKLPATAGWQPALPRVGALLQRSEVTVACVTQTRHDVTGRIQFRIDRRGDDVDIGMLRLNLLNPLLTRDQNDELNSFRPVLFQEIQRGA